MSSMECSACHSSRLSFIVNDIPENSERGKIHTWLAPLEQTKFLTDTSNIQEPGTSDWLLEQDKRIGDWRRNSPSLVWLYGDGLLRLPIATRLSLLT